jgi:hypothetical protein
VQAQAASSRLRRCLADQGGKEAMHVIYDDCDAPPRWSLPFDVYHISPVTGWNVMPTLLRIPAHNVPQRTASATAPSKFRCTVLLACRLREPSTLSALTSLRSRLSSSAEILALGCSVFHSTQRTDSRSGVPSTHLRRTPGGRCRQCGCARWCSTSRHPRPRRRICTGEHVSQRQDVLLKFGEDVA